MRTRFRSAVDAGGGANNYKPLHCYHWHILTTSVLVYPILYLSSYPTFGYILSP